MRRAKWSLKAARQLEAYLDHLQGVDSRLAEEALAEIHARADQTAAHPGLARPSMRWLDYRERSVKRWKKLLVLREVNGRMEVSAFFDMRQDLSRVRL